MNVNMFSCLNKTDLTDLSAQIRLRIYSGRIFFFTDILEEDSLWIKKRIFPNHPFKVIGDSQMIELQDSIKKYGVLNPLIVRPKIEGYYEIISGHRRKYAAEKLGYKKIPVIIRMLQDDEAVVIMVDSNLQREQITPSEKAYAYKMKYDAIKKRQAERIVVKLTTIQERGVLT